MLAGRAPTIFGDGRQQRDYVYVGDVVEAALLAAVREPATCVVGSGRGTETGEIERLLARLTGFEGDPILAPERPGDIRAIRLDASRALDRWGWSPRVPLEDGMAATVAWFRDRG